MTSLNLMIDEFYLTSIADDVAAGIAFRSLENVRYFAFNTKHYSVMELKKIKDRQKHDKYCLKIIQKKNVINILFKLK